MKKIISMIMALAIMALAAIAYAEGSTQESTTDVKQQSEQTQSGPMASGSNEGNRPASQLPQMPGTNGRNQQSRPPQMLSGNQNGNQQNGQPPQLPGTNGQNQQGQPPRLSSDNQNGNQQNGQPQEIPGGEVPVMIDFDAMVAKGVISKDTCGKIKVYMEEHKSADMPDSQPPTNAPAVTEEKPDSEKPADAPEMGGGLLADLLKDEIITQAEYDALIAAQTAETT